MNFAEGLNTFLKLHEIKIRVILTQNNRFPGTTQVPSYSRGNYYCSHCDDLVTLHKTPTDSWFIHSEPQTAERRPLVISKLKHLQDKHRLTLNVRSVSPDFKSHGLVLSEVSVNTLQTIKNVAQNVMRGFGVFLRGMLQRNI